MDNVKPRPSWIRNFGSFIREPGHIEYAKHLGLGVLTTSSKSPVTNIEV